MPYNMRVSKYYDCVKFYTTKYYKGGKGKKAKCGDLARTRCHLRYWGSHKSYEEVDKLVKSLEAKDRRRYEIRASIAACAATAVTLVGA